MADFSSTRSPRSHLSSRQRGRTACTRCKARKPRCDGQLPTFWNCAKSGAECDLNDIRSEDTGWVRYVGALENKVAKLELQLAQSKQESQDRTPSVLQAPTPGPGMPSSIGDVLNFLALGSFEPPLVGSSSGLALALNLGDIHISAARESRSLDSIEAMTLLVIFHLRSPVSPGLWYMIGLAMRTCVDLGLHSSRKEVEHDPATIQHRRKLFWSVYALERNIAISLGHPVSIPDRQIDVDLPTTDSWSLSTCWASIRPSCLFFYQRRRSSVSKEEAFGI
ncbi:hypothetical protein GQ53DRAFT_819014 [Thozetella sp. PMI_491]|nr:hypothetical protein GQ53DRAFT_819014 [Thozetella sp. PMI_491]